MANRGGAHSWQACLLIDDFTANPIDSESNDSAPEEEQACPGDQQFVNRKRKNIKSKVASKQRISFGKRNGVKKFQDSVPVAGLCKANEQTDQQSGRGNDQAPGNSVQRKLDNFRHAFDIWADDSETISPACSRGASLRGNEAVDPKYSGREYACSDKDHDHGQPHGREYA